MSKSFADDFIKIFRELDLPREIAGRFQTIQCLSETENSGTYLLSERNSGQLFVLKTTSKSDMPPHTGHDAELLCALSHKGLPKLEAVFENGDSRFTLWEYVDGIPLDQYLSEHPISREQIIDISTKLCDILTFLHTQPEPIIHRDIKPSNIILDPRDQAVTLIDFGISRKYIEGATRDTVYLGTQKFAPPEQYGFTQTDCRADLYALGVLLRYMLTGETDSNIEIRDKELDRIVRKCSAFSPDKRYKCAAALKRALISAKKRKRRKTLSGLAAVLAACLLLTIGFVVGRLTGVVTPPAVTDAPAETDDPAKTNAPTETDDPAARAVMFKEPLIEQAVRLSLGKGAGEEITHDELKGITRLFFAGQEIANADKGFGEISNAFNESTEWYSGTIQTLDDLRMLPNLREVSFSDQPFIDLSPLADCLWLRSLYFKRCSFWDLSPLVKCARLESLSLDQCAEVTDISLLAEVENLTYLNIRVNTPRDLTRIGNIRSLRTLVLCLPETWVDGFTDWVIPEQLEVLDLFLKLNSLDGIERFQHLKELRLGGEAVLHDLSPLNGCPALRTLSVPSGSESVCETLTNSDVMVILR